MEFNQWKKVKLKEILEINPRRSLKKGEVSKKIAMEQIKEFTRKIQGFEMSEYKSGSKFQNGDTLMARITPCLENGKTAFVDVLNENEIAFGSTEYFVLTAKEELADPKFVYYLSISDDIRKVVIQSMTGTSGRQRAQKDSILNFEKLIPPLNIQKKISALLSLIDDKIELNKEIINSIEEVSSVMYKHWFIDFQFPDEKDEPYLANNGEMVETKDGLIPVNWRSGSLGEIVKISSGKRPVIKKDNLTDVDNIPVIGASKIMGYTNEVLFNKPIIIIGRVGTHGVIQRFNTPCWPSDNTLVFESDFLEFTYHFLKSVDYNALNRGSTQPLVTQGDIKQLPLILPSDEIIKRFELEQKKYTDLINMKKEENKLLNNLRDTLLPNLLNGEIDFLEGKR